MGVSKEPNLSSLTKEKLTAVMTELPVQERHLNDGIENGVWNSPEDELDAFLDVNFSNMVSDLSEASKQVKKRERLDKETALTLLRDERILRIFAQSSIETKKAKVMREEDIKKTLDKERIPLEGEAHDYVRIIEMTYPENEFSSKEKRNMAEKFKQFAVYKEMRESLLKAGQYDVTKIQNPEKR